MATVFSKIITALLNAIYYENILERESYEKYNFMNKNLKRKIGISMYVYSYKCKNALSKVKILNAIEKVYFNTRKKLEVDKKRKYMKKDGSAAFNKSKQDLNRKNLNHSKISDETITHLLNHDIHNIEHKIEISEIFSPKPYYDENLYQIEIYEKNLMDQKFKIKKQFSICIPRFKIVNRKSVKKFVFSISEVTYNSFIVSKTMRISKTSLQIMKAECLKEETKSKMRRSFIKSIMYGVILFTSYIFLFIMITDIYNKYEDNIFEICIIPLLSVLISKFLITQNVMIFIHSFFMYKFGQKFYSDNRKKLNPLGIIFKFVIPAISKANHKSLLLFRDFCHKQK
jgi:hypothetical protein